MSKYEVTIEAEVITVNGYGEELLDVIDNFDG